MFPKYIINDVSEIHDANLGANFINKEDIFPCERGCLDASIYSNDPYLKTETSNKCSGFTEFLGPMDRWVG
jgi:hypothetical protein